MGRVEPEVGVRSLVVGGSRFLLVPDLPFPAMLSRPVPRFVRVGLIAQAFI